MAQTLGSPELGSKPGSSRVRGQIPDLFSCDHASHWGPVRTELDAHVQSHALSNLTGSLT